MRQFKEPRFSCPLHYHPEIELTYIAQSSGTRIVGDHIGSFSPGDLCLIGENLPHVYRNPEQSADTAVSEVLHFDRNLAEGMLDEAPELGAWSRLLDRAKLGLAFDRATATRTGDLLVKLRTSQGAMRWSLFFEIIHVLCKADKLRTLSSPGYTGDLELNEAVRIQNTCHYLLEHFHEDLSHEEMARRVHVTPAYFSRLFKRATRKTYKEFLTEVRLGHACRLLMETEMPIIDVAFASGFANLSNFNRRFRDKYRMCPRDYRKRMLQPGTH